MKQFVPAFWVAFWASLGAARGADPTEATVFIRVIGEVRAEYRETWEESEERRNVDLGTGSGFVISPYGHVLTNYHVISGGEFTQDVDGTEVRVQIEVNRVEVVFPSASGAEDEVAGRFLAAIDAVDPELDLAVLSINGVDLPYVPFGDSEAVEPGDAVSIHGFPFGAGVEVGKTRLPEIVPRVSSSRGTVSAIRADDADRRRYIQTNATMNPGNSGGPLVDEEGYALGVVRMKLAEADRVGFAVSINVVKDFLEAHGLDSLLPARRLSLGPLQILDGKGVRMRFPDGAEDLSPRRLLVDSGQSLEAVTFRLDRVASPFSVDELGEALLSGQVFESFLPRGERRQPPQQASEGVLVGEITGRLASGTAPWKMVYVIVDLGEEKIIARFLGAAEQVAFNRGVLRDSLRSLETRPLLSAAVREMPPAGWSDASMLTLGDLPSTRVRSILVPLNWLLEPGAPFPCADAPAPASALAASPPGDFTVSLRAAYWPGRAEAPERAASACSTRRGDSGEDASYMFRSEWLGLSYTVQGSFIRDGDGLLQLEVVSLSEHEASLREVFAAWVRENIEVRQ